METNRMYTIPVPSNTSKLSHGVNPRTLPVSFDVDHKPAHEAFLLKLLLYSVRAGNIGPVGLTPTGFSVYPSNHAPFDGRLNRTNCRLVSSFMGTDSCTHKPSTQYKWYGLNKV